MSKKRISMRDIAKECGVSVATVSYVLNHSTKESISHDTRLRILMTATKMHYTPPTPSTEKAATLHHLIGIIINLGSFHSPEKKLIHYDLAAELSKQLNEEGFQTILIPYSEIKKDQPFLFLQPLDGLFCIDMEYSEIPFITKDFYVPFIFLNTKISDPIFCKIYPDYFAIAEKSKTLLKSEDIFLVMERPNNQQMMEQILKSIKPFDAFIKDGEASLTSFLDRHHMDKGIILGDILALECIPYISPNQLVVVSYLGKPDMFPESIHLLYVRNENMAAVAIETFKSMLAFGYHGGVENHILIDFEES